MKIEILFQDGSLFRTKPVRSWEDPAAVLRASAAAWQGMIVRLKVG